MTRKAYPQNGFCQTGSYRIRTCIKRCSMKKLSVPAQFKLGGGLILFVVCVGASVLVYLFGKHQVELAVYKETEFYIAAVEATRTYVKDVLRPKMYEILPEDHFVVEAMSTSFVGRDIMGRVHDRFRNFRYKRASKRPMNPMNQADELELEMIDKFNRDPNIREWSGILHRDGYSFYTRARAIYAEAECLRCHGDPGSAPPAIIERYGAQNSGYGYEVGEVVAADTVYIPVDFYFTQIKRQAWLTFFIGGAVLLLLITLFYTLFNYTVISELKGLITVFRRIGGKNTGTKENEPQTLDEIEQLKAAFQNAATDLEKTHNELQDSESKYRRIFETSRDAIFIWSVDKKMMDINAAGIRMFQFRDKPEALSIETVEQLFWDARDGVEMLDILREQGFVKEHEVSLVNRNGDHLHGLVTANLYSDEHGGPVGFEGTIRDITEKKRLAEHLARTEKLAAVGQLAAGLAHEINNPLGVIHCYANLIEKSAADDASVKKDVEIIRKHTLGCKKIVEDLLNFSRMSGTQKDKGDIRTAVDSVLSILEKQMSGKRIRLRQEHAARLPAIVFDMDKMKQVFMNLLLNALQSMDSGGEIRVSTRCDTDDRFVDIRIEDSGCGIPPDRIDSIFDPFFTTKPTGEGTGLGLSISYGIVKDHGGDILVDSRPGKGCVFTVRLPV